MDSTAGCSGCLGGPWFGEDAGLLFGPGLSHHVQQPQAFFLVCSPGSAGQRVRILLAVPKVPGALMIFHPACLTGLTRVLSHRNY